MIYNILFLFILFLSSCDFDDSPISVDNIDQDELSRITFNLDLEKSDTLNRISPIGESLLIYAGQDYYGSNIYSFFSLNNEVFSNYDLCDNDTISYKNLYLVIDLIKDYESNHNFNNQPPDNNMGMDASSISAYWVDYSDVLNSNGESLISNEWLESDTLIFDDININIDQLNAENDGDSNSPKRLFVEKTLGKYYIELTDHLVKDSEQYNCVATNNADECNALELCEWVNDECSNLINSIDICNIDANSNKLILLVSNSEITHEFASANYISDYSNTQPYLNILYDDFEELTKQSKKIILNTINPNYGTTHQYISDTLLNNYNYIFSSNLFSQDTTIELTDSLIWSDYAITDPLIIQSNLNEEIHLLDINIDLVNIDNYSSSGISFWLDNIKYLKYDDDPNNDNWNPEDSTGTEGNGIWDIGEYIDDYGLDLCSSYFEDGLGGCITDSTMSAYNIEGTEGNNIWDNGENYKDYGLDGCPDIYEDSLGGCLCVDINECNEELVCEDDDMDGLCDDGLDPNLDNYNNDPSGDDWFDVNNNGIWDGDEGLESNNQRDEGELFLDIGFDGLSEDLVGYADQGENNGIYDFGEPYFDTGLDTLFNIDELGYNISGNQNNLSYQFGEPFDDCGTDSDCNDNDVSDDFNIDPNNDNWNDCGSDNICPNNENYIEPDLDGSELNGVWDQNEGTELNGEHDRFFDYDSLIAEEYYEDYGIDNIQNDNELSSNSQEILVSMTDTTFFDYVNNSVEFGSETLSNQENDSLKIWISNIEEDSDSSLKISISFLAEHSVSGLEFKLHHDIYVAQIMDWNSRERNVAKVDFDNYINDFSAFNHMHIDTSSHLFMNYAHGILTLLDFEGLSDFIDNNKDIIINENNSNLTLFFNKDSSDFILESNNYIIDFNKYENAEISSLFSFFVQNNPDSLVVPIGNLIQQYISEEHNYGDGIVIGLNPNQYPPAYNFNNIILDTTRSPKIEVYYFK